MGKLEAKALFYIELNGGFVRLSLRKTIEKPAIRLAFLFCRRQKLAFVSNVKRKRQGCAATGFSIALIFPLKGSRVAY
jgi:hypothetical protein